MSPQLCAVLVATLVLAGVAPSATPPHGAAFVSSLPTQAEVWVDGTYGGRTPLYVDALRPGQHSFTVVRSGWAPASIATQIDIGRIATVSFVLQRVGATVHPAGEGQLSVRGGEPGWKVAVDGKGAGSLPMQPLTLKAGTHIVTVRGMHGERFVRAVEVFPQTTTVVMERSGPATDTVATGDDTTLAPIDAYVPGSDVVVAGATVAIHHQGVEVECTIGSRDYVFNGRAERMSVAPALVGGKVLLPLSLLKKIAPR